MGCSNDVITTDDKELNRKIRDDDSSSDDEVADWAECKSK